ncbi:MAG: endonuclease III domain-containing protein [Dehalococcoidia bacterium]
MHQAAEVADLVAALEAMHGRRHWHWWPDGDPFEVIVGAILVQNTAWTNVEHALRQLREAGALCHEAMARLSTGDLEALIRPSGQFRQKAKKLQAVLATTEAAGGLDRLLARPAPELRATLLATWGIGPETADCIVLYAARQPAVIVDAYLRRIFGRLGLGPSEAASYATWQAWLEPRLPRERDPLSRFHAEVVQHCKHLCRKANPRCSDCALARACTVPP